MNNIANKLMNYLESHKEEISPLLILTHDHPDPDSMAAAYALKLLAMKKFGIRSKIVYGGRIGRMENQTMAEELRIPITPIKKNDFKKFKAVALIDTQASFENNSCPNDMVPAIVIDHHPLAERTKAGCLLVYPKLGATVTILANILIALHFKISKNLATGMLYGILSETQNLGREVSRPDMKVYRELHAIADMQVLAQIQNPVRRKGFFKTIGRAITNACVVRRLIAVHLGDVETPDLVSQIADFLLAYRKMRWSLCTGRYKGKLYISLRTINTRAHAGKILERTLGEPGRGGGHGMIAGGSIELGPELEEEDWKKCEKNIVSRLLEELDWNDEEKMEFPFKEEE